RRRHRIRIADERRIGPRRVRDRLLLALLASDEEEPDAIFLDRSAFGDVEVVIASEFVDGDDALIFELLREVIALPVLDAERRRSAEVVAAFAGILFRVQAAVRRFSAPAAVLLDLLLTSV